MFAARYQNALRLKVIADKKRRIQKLVESGITFFRAHRGAAHGVNLTLKKLSDVDLNDRSFIDAPAQRTRHDEGLRNAIARIAAP